MNKKVRKKDINRRQYIRLNVIFPLEFQFIDPETGGSLSEIKQGFTRNISKGGICLEVTTVEESFEDTLKSKKANLDLRLHVPLSSRETKATAKIEWYKKIKSGYPSQYLIGLSFVNIDPKDRDRIYLHVKRIAIAPKITAVLVISMLLLLFYSYAIDFKLKRENKYLVDQLVMLSDRKASLEGKIFDFEKEKNSIKEVLSENEEKVKIYEAKARQLEKISKDLENKEELLEDFKEEKIDISKKLKQANLEKDTLSKKIEDLTIESEYLKARVSELSHARVSMEDNLKELLFSFEEVEEKNIRSMYKWIRNHQNSLTGLIISYEGDKELEDWAFTYDQSLASQCFTLMGDRENAKRVLDFYRERAKRVEGAFPNAYDAYTGLVTEYNVNAGPNIWLGIAILKYTEKFNDPKYLLLAEEIGEWLINLQGEDKEFGIRGGPLFRWFSTEHNLDAYAFFGMLYKVTKKEIYLQSQERTLSWIKKNAYNKQEARLNRGRGDATIATDTFTWAIASLGPEILKSSGMDPDQIIDFAEANCLVTTYFKRPNGDVIKVTGFDFGKYQHTARGGVISTEWTAQMVVTMKIMEEYHKSQSNFVKEDYYKRKSDFYLAELEKMVITSLSRIGQGEGCLPYASQDNVDTGHGWRVPNGSRTGSTAGTAYTIFAKYNYNPLKF